MQFDDKLIYLLSTAQHSLRMHLNNVFSREGLKITPPQCAVLFLLRQKDGRNLSEFSKILGVDNSAMTGLIDRLEKTGFVERRINPNDRRAILVYLTQAGKSEGAKGEIIYQRINQRVEKEFEPQEFEAFKRVLVGIREKFSAK
jgi:DNA-binding MarR family transcriptional regulator